MKWALIGVKQISESHESDGQTYLLKEEVFRVPTGGTNLLGLKQCVWILSGRKDISRRSLMGFLTAHTKYSTSVLIMQS